MQLKDLVFYFGVEDELFSFFLFYLELQLLFEDCSFFDNTKNNHLQ